eukprot:1755946-Ditylum_brightwellii.AAC.1
MVLDVDKIRTGAMKAISHYKSEQDKTKMIMVKMLFYTMMEYTNGLEKILPHKRVVLKEEMENIYKPTIAATSVKQRKRHSQKNL